MDLTITNNNPISAVNEWEISTEGSCSDHKNLKYKIGIANRFNNGHNYQSIIYLVKEDKYHEFDRNLVQETLKNTYISRVFTNEWRSFKS